MLRQSTRRLSGKNAATHQTVEAVLNLRVDVAVTQEPPVRQLLYASFMTPHRKTLPSLLLGVVDGEIHQASVARVLHGRENERRVGRRILRLVDRDSCFRGKVVDEWRKRRDVERRFRRISRPEEMIDRE